MTRIVTPQESAALEVFRSRIPDILVQLTEFQRQDLWLLRWLRDKELNVDRAEKLLRKTVEWRKENKMDSLLDYNLPEYIDKNYIYFSPGFNKEGHILCIVNFGKWDFKKMCGKGFRNDIIRFAEQILESGLNGMEIVSAASGKFMFKFTIIFDFDGFSMGQLMSQQVIATYIECLNIFRYHYPESLSSAWMVNIPSFFDIFFRIIKPFLPARTLQRIHIHGKEGWRQELLKEFDAEELPSSFGGANTTCPEFQVRNGYEHLMQKYETFPDEEFEEEILNPGENLPLSHHLLTGHRMSWNFRSDDVDVGYVVQFQKELTDKPKILFECAHADSHLHLQKGGIMATDPGIYSLILENNEKSKSKNIYYAVRIETDIREFPPWALTVKQVKDSIREKFFEDENQNFT